MKEGNALRVAVLLATWNGARHVAEQLRSLKENRTKFVLHWLDDDSTDNTREVVRSTARKSGIELREWHQDRHVGLPGSFFTLLEGADADVYFFCDQDDIWQPGRIDAMTEALRAEVGQVVLCVSDSLMFREGQPGWTQRYSELLADYWGAVLEGRTFGTFCFPGHCHAFTKPLRDIFMGHTDVARRCTFMHDWWIPLLALACGNVRFLDDVPMVRWRQHDSSFCHEFESPKNGRLTSIQNLRRILARHVTGFKIVAPSLPPSEKLSRMLRLARVASKIDQRLNLVECFQFLRLGIISMKGSPGWWWTLALLCTSAAAPPHVSEAEQR